MEIEATSADRNLLLEMKGELDHHGARNALRELELSIDAGACWCGTCLSRHGGSWMPPASAGW